VTQPLLSLDQVAERCGLSVKAIRRAVDRGELPASKLCGRMRVDPTALAEWIERSRVGAEQSEPPPAREQRPTGGTRRLRAVIGD